MRQQQMDYVAAQAREAEAQRAAALARAEAEVQARAVAAAQTAAETSPDNLCRQPDTARNLIKEYNGMEWPGYSPRQVVDIEHLAHLIHRTRRPRCHNVYTTAMYTLRRRLT